MRPPGKLLFDFAAWLVAILLLILCAYQCRGGDDDDLQPVRIVLPMSPVLTEPDSPPPPPNPKVIDTLKADEWYVVESTVELIALQSPGGFVSIDVDAGPITLRGRFADGNGKVERRKYSSPYVYTVTGEKAGKLELILIPVGVAHESDIVRQVLTVSGQGPQPPPDPVDPIVDPVDPITPAKLQVVIIEDPALRGSLPADQIAAMDGAEVRDYCKTHCVLTNGTPDFRKLSLRQDVSGQPEWIKTAFAEPRSVLPFLVILTPTKTISGPLPATVAETMAMLKKYGGN